MEKAMLQNSPLYAYIPAKDVSRARKFYEEKLGFKAAREEVAGGVVYEFGKGTACFLYPTPNAGTSRASQAFWQVTDVEREVAELKSKGVKFEEYNMPGMKDGIMTAGGAKSAWFRDTEGNILALVQERGPPPSLDGRERRARQDRVGELLHDGAVLRTLAEHASPLGILGECVELGHPFVEALPGEQVDELVIVAAHPVQPVA